MTVDTCFLMTIFIFQAIIVIYNTRITYTAKCCKIQSFKSHLTQHWVLSNAVHAHNLCFECLF